MLRASGNLLETMATWGPTAPRQRVFGPGECWAFRRGRPHMVEERESPLRCAHLAPEDGAVSICVPMMAQGDNLGILQFNFSSIDDQEPAEDNRPGVHTGAPGGGTGRAHRAGPREPAAA